VGICQGPVAPRTSHLARSRTRAPSHAREFPPSSSPLLPPLLQPGATLLCSAVLSRRGLSRVVSSAGATALPIGRPCIWKQRGPQRWRPKASHDPVSVRIVHHHWPQPRPSLPSCPILPPPLLPALVQPDNHTTSKGPSWTGQRSTFDRTSKSRRPGSLLKSRRTISSGWGNGVFCRQDLNVCPSTHSRPLVPATHFFSPSRMQFIVATIQSASLALQSRAQSRA
jgi:hypothetical protein